MAETCSRRCYSFTSCDACGTGARGNPKWHNCVWRNCVCV